MFKIDTQSSFKKQVFRLIQSDLFDYLHCGQKKQQSDEVQSGRGGVKCIMSELLYNQTKSFSATYQESSGILEWQIINVYYQPS